MSTDGGPAMSDAPVPEGRGVPPCPDGGGTPGDRNSGTAATGLACWLRTDSGGSDRSGPVVCPRQEGADQEDRCQHRAWTEGPSS